MKEGFRQSMAWLHTWSGLLVGWVLFFIFITGTAGYFDTEIDRWMQPELPMLNEPQPSTVQAVEQGLSHLRQVAPNAEHWVVYPPSGHPQPHLSVAWSEPNGIFRQVSVDPASGEAVKARETGGGQQLYQMHYLLHYLPTMVAYWIVGICSMIMLVAIISGVITHKRIFKDFFTFRPSKGKRSWLDAHNVLSVLTLPFFLMITYSGLLFLMFNYMPLILSSTYGSEAQAQRAFFDEAYSSFNIPERSREPADLADTANLLAIAEQQWGSAFIWSYSVWNPDDRNARIALSQPRPSPQSNANQLLFAGVSGELLADSAPPRLVSRQVNDVLLGLHEGLFAPPLLRWLYFISGLAGAAIIATGLILWTLKRLPSKLGDHRHPGLIIVEKLNIATLAGLPIAIAGYFWANRLLAVNLDNRAAMEVHVMFSVWVLAFLIAVFRKPSEAWFELCALAALSYMSLPLVNWLTTDRHLAKTIPAGDWQLAGFDLTVLALGLMFAAIARHLWPSYRSILATGRMKLWHYRRELAD